MHFFEKPWKMLEDIEMSNLQQLKEGIIQYQNQTIMQQNFDPEKL